MNRTFELSLRFKSALLVIVLLMFAAGLMYSLSIEQLKEQEYLTSQQKKSALIESLNELEAQSLNNLDLLSEQIGAFQRYSEDIESFEQMLINSWEDLSLTGALSSIKIYRSSSNSPVIQLGDDQIQSLDVLVTEVIETGEKISKFLCLQQCLFVNIVPIFDERDPSAIVLVEPFTNILSALAKIHDVNVAILNTTELVTEQGNLQSSVWDSELVTLTNSFENLDLLNMVASKTEIQGLIDGLEQVNYNDRTLRVWATHHRGDTQKEYPIVILDDITVEARNLAEHQNNLTIYIVLTISLFGGFVIAFAMKPINKIKKLTSQYPNIALHRFDDAKKALPNTKRLFRDEIDILYSETHELIQQLQTLYHDLDHKNRVLEHKAMHDELTGLGNRNRLNYELEKVIELSAEHKNRWALVEMDLDNFKHVNDTLGHYAGDQLLKIIAARLNETVRPEDTVCRLGGDEFMIILDEIRSRDDINSIMQKLFSALQQPINIGQRKINVKASAGIYTIDNPNTDIIQSLKSADLALYAAKESGKNCYRIFDEDMSRTAEKNFIIENDFERSLNDEEFFLVYQPQICSKTGTLIGLEALVRWNHRETDLYPNMFIPILEESDKIIKLGAWVMERAIKDLAELHKRLPDLKMAVNLSVRQIFEADLIKQTADLCDRYGIRYDRLELEITETALINDINHAKQVLEEARSLGFMVAIDDFGTGYSSLSYISQLSFDTIKLDRSFIRHLTYSSAEEDMLSAVIYMTKRMSSEVVAEGVEDVEHFKILQDLECDVLQGFLIQRPDTLANLSDDIDQYVKIGVWPSIVSLVPVTEEAL